MKLATLVFFGLLITRGCSDAGSPPENANTFWLDRLIEQFQNTPVGNPPRSVWKYEYRGQIVYYVPPQCCDQFSILYDAAGKVLCAPDGGLTGRGDGKCPDFFQERKNGVLVWQDPRSR
jgi:hypothetical protein